MKNLLLCVAALAAMLFSPGVAVADDGHDHGGAPTTTTTVDSARPRFAAVSENYELVGVLNGKEMTLYLDRFADNSPVTDAQLVLEVGGVKVATESHAEGEFDAVLATVPEAGALSVKATVITDKAAEVLTGEFDLHEGAHAEAASTPVPWRRTVLWALGALFVLASLAWLVRRTAAVRQSRSGGAA